MKDKEMPEIRIGVSRHLHNRPGEPLPDSPVALELHNRRKVALHDYFDGDSSFRVRDWGAANDTRAHEYVELVVEIALNPQVQAIAVPALAFVGGVISNALGNLVADSVKALIARLRNSQAEGKFQELYIILPDGTSVVSKPVNGNTELTVVQPGRAPITVGYNDTEQEVQNKVSSS